MASTGNDLSAAPQEMMRPASPFTTGHQNVSETERLVSAVAGGALALYGLARGSLSGWALALIGGSLVYRGVTGHCSMYQALGVDTAHEHGPIGVAAQHGARVEKSIIVNRPAQELFDYWRKFEHLPRIMDHLISVEELSGTRSRWVAKGPLGTTVEWEAEIHNERNGELIAWRSIPGSGDVDTAGSVHFKELPNDRGTVITVNLKFDPPGGAAALSIADFLGQGLEDRVEEDLRNFKQMMEAGAGATAENQSSGRIPR